MPWIPLVLTAIFLSACVTVAERDEMSPYFIIPAGSRLILNRDLEIPAHRNSGSSGTFPRAIDGQ